jgi:hypothetical protein
MPPGVTRRTPSGAAIASWKDQGRLKDYLTGGLPFIASQRVEVGIMAPRTFISFSGTDIKSFWLMKAWKENEHIDVEFVDCQLDQEVHSEDEAYIKRICRERIGMAGTFVLIVGADTRSKHKYVRWECDVAIEQHARLIVANLNGSRYADDLCPPIVRDKGAMFIPFGQKILGYTLREYKGNDKQDWHWKPNVYEQLGL